MRRVISACIATLVLCNCASKTKTIPRPSRNVWKILSSECEPHGAQAICPRPVFHKGLLDILYLEIENSKLKVELEEKVSLSMVDVMEERGLRITAEDKLSKWWRNPWLTIPLGFAAGLAVGIGIGFGK